MIYIIILHLIGILLVWIALWRSLWRKKAQQEQRLVNYIIGGLIISLIWEPFYILAIWKDIK